MAADFEAAFFILMKKKILFELCAADIRSVEIADHHAVDAIELCQDLNHGGITPSYSHIKCARKIFGKELAILIRPRLGHFVYNPMEKQLMLEDIRVAIDLGADALVVGALTDTNEIDVAFMEEIIANSMGITLCFHRAFDMVADPFHSLNHLMELQIDRLLTSGQHKTAWEGREMLKQLIDTYEDKIRIMPGCGIHTKNVQAIINDTGAQRVHASLKQKSIQHSSTLALGQEELVDENELIEMLKLIKS